MSDEQRIEKYAREIAAYEGPGEWWRAHESNARGVIAIADAEQAQLRLRLTEAIHFQDVERAKRREAEAKVARVGPFLDYIEEMWDGCEPGLGCTGCEVKQKVADLRAALEDLP